MNEAADLTRQTHPRALPKAKAADVFVKFLVADGQSEFRRPDVTRFDQNVADAQIAIRVMIVKRGAAVVPDAVFAKNL